MFLTLFSSSPKVNAQSGTLELIPEDSNQFKTLDNGATKFMDAMILLFVEKAGEREWVLWVVLVLVDKELDDEE